MIIDYTQNKESVEISYVNEQKQISMITVPLKHGYYKYVRAEEWELDSPNIIKGLRSFKNNELIKRETAKYFANHNINEFLNREIPQEHPQIWEKISQLYIPNPYSVDIETDITDEYGYSTPEKAENAILSISITDVNLNTLVFVYKNGKDAITDNDKIHIQKMIHDSLGEKYLSEYEFNFIIREFDEEKEMLNVFLECINKYFHSFMGWNFEAFDWVYIFNRCERLGIDIKKASPIGRAISKKVKAKKKDAENEIEIKLPAHRIIGDYMMMFKKSLIYNNLGNYSLNSIAGDILGLKKIMYEGNLRTLYRNEYNKFIAYAIIDTILVMLIHKKTNLYDIDFFESYMNGIAYQKISQNSISEALVYNKIRPEGKFLLETEFNFAEKKDYPGGYVKAPVKKIVEAVLGVDFSGLYPNSMITIGISPDRKVDRIAVDAFGMPIDKVNEEIWLKYKASNHILSPRGIIYYKGDIKEDGTHEDGLYPAIEKSLIGKRKIFKGHVSDLYLTIDDKIKNRIKDLQKMSA